MYLSVDLELEPIAAHLTINTKDLIIVLGRPALLNVLLHQKKWPQINNAKEGGNVCL